jgi:hypothetical protein
MTICHYQVQKKRWNEWIEVDALQGSVFNLSVLLIRITNRVKWIKCYAKYLEEIILTWLFSMM